MPKRNFDDDAGRVARESKRRTTAAETARAQKMHEFKLKQLGFSGVKFVSDYAFHCDQNGARCPLCPETHKRKPYAVYRRRDDKWYVKNLSEKCVERVFASEALPAFAFLGV